MKQYCCENWEYCDESPENCPIAQRNKAYVDFINAKEALIALIFEAGSELHKKAKKIMQRMTWK